MHERSCRTELAAHTVHWQAFRLITLTYNSQQRCHHSPVHLCLGACHSFAPKTHFNGMQQTLISTIRGSNLNIQEMPLMLLTLCVCAQGFTVGQAYFKVLDTLQKDGQGVRGSGLASACSFPPLPNLCMQCDRKTGVLGVR